MDSSLSFFLLVKCIVQNNKSGEETTISWLRGEEKIKQLPSHYLLYLYIFACLLLLADMCMTHEILFEVSAQLFFPQYGVFHQNPWSRETEEPEHSRFLTYKKKKVNVLNGLSWWLSSKESACNAGDHGSIPGWGRSPLNRKDQKSKY